MGLARIIFGFDKSDLENLRRENEKLLRAYAELKQRLEQTIILVETLADRVKGLEEENKALKEALYGYARDLESVEGDLGSLTSLVSSLDQRLTQLEDKLEEEAPAGGEESVTDDAVQVVLEKIREGITSPSEIIEATGLSKHKVYEALKRLVSEGLVEKRREGRRVHYYPVQAQGEPSSKSNVEVHA